MGKFFFIRNKTKWNIYLAFSSNKSEFQFFGSLDLTSIFLFLFFFCIGKEDLWIVEKGNKCILLLFTDNAFTVYILGYLLFLVKVSSTSRTEESETKFPLGSELIKLWLGYNPRLPSDVLEDVKSILHFTKSLAYLCSFNLKKGIRYFCENIETIILL